MTSINTSPENFTVGRLFKIMPFLTLFSDKNVVIESLNGESGVVFEITGAEGYDISRYSMANPESHGTMEVVMEPESVFRIEGYAQISRNVAEVSLLYVRENSEFPLTNLGESNSGNYNNYNPYSGASAPSNPYYGGGY